VFHLGHSGDELTFAFEHCRPVSEATPSVGARFGHDDFS
jgi:hypothetical protein